MQNRSRWLWSSFEAPRPMSIPRRFFKVSRCCMYLVRCIASSEQLPTSLTWKRYGCKTFNFRNGRHAARRQRKGAFAPPKSQPLAPDFGGEGVIDEEWKKFPTRFPTVPRRSVFVSLLQGKPRRFGEKFASFRNGRRRLGPTESTLGRRAGNMPRSRKSWRRLFCHASHCALCASSCQSGRARNVPGFLRRARGSGTTN